MTTFAAAPASPPELSSSKSSKSSSFHSDGVLSDLAHFEDIGLHDERPFSTQEIYGRNSSSTSLTSFRRTQGTMNQGRRTKAPPMPGMRELTTGMRKPMHPTQQEPLRRPSGHGPGPLSVNVVNGSAASEQMRNVASPSPLSPSAMTALRNRSKSRSPSPGGQRPFQLSPRSSSTHCPYLGPGPLPPPRRSLSRNESWQPSRKTTKQLEDEYHDSDEDLPDDASLWNVPLSPSLFRTASTKTSANPSTSTSPERPSQLGVSLAKAKTVPIPPKTAPANSQRFSTNPTKIPISSALPPIFRAVSMNGPSEGNFAETRSKSWNVALNELSEEAISLSEALEAYARESKQGNKTGQSSIKTSSIERQSLDATLKRSKTNGIELPPLRKGEVMVDPLPISKEKAKVLSRTRPSWLPPKNPKEEAKHLKEYQRMMELSLEAEKKKAAQAASLVSTATATSSILTRIWTEHVLPKFSDSIREPRTRELWWRGIPSSLRPEIYRRAIGNELALTDTTYTKALARARSVLREMEISGNPAAGRGSRIEAEWFSAIARDVEDTMPDLGVFQTGQTLHLALVDVLLAYAMYRSDVGYVHGIHLPAALLLYTYSLPPSSPNSNEKCDLPPDPASESTSLAFLSLANLLNRPLPLSFLTSDPSGMHKTYALVLNLLELKLPRLFGHLFREEGLELAPDQVLDPMIRTLFGEGCCSSFGQRYGSAEQQAVVRNGLSLTHLQRLVDVLVFDGDTFVIRACVGILAALEHRLYGGKAEVCGLLGWGRGTAAREEQIRQETSRDGDEGMGSGAISPGLGIGRGWGDMGDIETFLKIIRGVGKEGDREREREMERAEE